VIRIPSWLFAILVPIMFIGGCTLTVRPVWTWQERNRIRAVGDRDKEGFPVLVRNPDSIYSVASLGAIPEGGIIVTGGFDEEKINMDLNASIGSKGRHPYFRLLNKTEQGTRVSLEIPTKRDAKKQGWYEIVAGHVIPKEILYIGPGFPMFYVLPWTAGCGLVATVAFATWVRPKRPRCDSSDRS
jgi:hypothetical protein